VLVSEAAETWSEDRRRAVMLHELAHVRRRDSLTQTLASLATALYWPHPGVWWAARRLQVEREFACDDCVLGAGAPADSYASDLLEIAYTLGGRRSPALAVTMARRGQLEGRLLAVLDAARNRATPGLTSRVAASLAALAILVPVAAMGITMRAASLPIGADDYTPPTLTQAPAGHAGQPSTRGTAPQATRLAKTLYAWSDVVQQAVSTSGTWTVQLAEKPGEVYLEMRQLRWSSGRTMPLARLEGVTASQLNGGGNVKFQLRREAGIFTFEGMARDGAGGGTYSFAPNPSFGDELARRGVARPNAHQQYEMALADVGWSLVDDLKADGYQTPSLDELVQAAYHGVSSEYVRQMSELGYKVGSVEALISMRDHGVTPDFVRGLAAEGLSKLSADELVNTRDHGVTPEYVQALRQLGYSSLTVDELIATRDHGVTPDYVKDLGALGYSNLTLDELRMARDHGVTPDYVKALASLGYSKLSLDEVQTTRDHGVTPDYVRELGGLGYSNLTLDELRMARDHGVTPEYVKELASLGYSKLTLDELRTARDHGVTPDYVRGLKDLGYAQLSIEELRTLRDHGATPDRVKRANDNAGTKLSPEMLRSVLDGGMR
jgi:hypothetical protein